MEPIADTQAQVVLQDPPFVPVLYCTAGCPHHMDQPRPLVVQALFECTGSRRSDLARRTFRFFTSAS